MPSGTLCGLHEVERRLHAKTSVLSTWTERRIWLGGSHTVFASGRECDGFPMARRGKTPVTHVKGGQIHSLYLEVPQILLYKSFDGLGNKRVQLLGCANQSIPEIS